MVFCFRRSKGSTTGARAEKKSERERREREKHFSLFPSKEEREGSTTQPLSYTRQLIILAASHDRAPHSPFPAPVARGVAGEGRIARRTRD